MAFCPPACAPISIPTPPTASCISDVRVGGLCDFFVGKCTFEFTDVTDPAEWTAAFSSGDLRVVKGIKSDGTPDVTVPKVQTTSCGSERPNYNGATTIITFQDYNADLTGNTDDVFWSWIKTNSAKIGYSGFTDSNGNVYVYTGGSFTVIDRFGETTADFMFKEVQAEYRGILPDRQYLPLVVTAIRAA